ncbi:aBC-type branched-chain amino acid transport system permease component [Firmicutes bacterium CAG:555]|nr:branched-chain amino acid ABC transporter permease [Bacillota bacterium]CCX72006.1 aBC-type branched-chain amino acid transport system permease component [Firmicutes bacterium CAG:555]
MMNKTMQKEKVLRTPEELAKRQGMWLTIIALAVVYILLFALDNFIKPSKFTLMLIPVLRKGAIYSLLCVSMNLLNGFTGLFSLGQAGFMLIGAYAYSIFSIPAAQHASVYQYFDGGAIQFSIPEAIGNVLGVNAGSFLGAIICIIIAGIAAAIFAALIGIPVLRLKSDYLAIATLGFAEIIRAFFQWDSLGEITNGSNLLRKYTAFSDMNIQLGTSVFKLGTIFPFFIAMISIAMIVLLINSSYGRAFKAIRDDEVAAEAMGINLFKHKMLSFVISSFFAGVGGALLAMFQTTVQASAFMSSMTYEILLIVVIGGIGSVSGSCIAAFLYIACSEWWLRFLDSGAIGSIQVSFFRDGFRKVVFSVVIMIIVLFFSKGIMGNKELSFAGLIRKIQAKKAAKAVKAEAGGAAK